MKSPLSKHFTVDLFGPSLEPCNLQVVRPKTKFYLVNPFLTTSIKFIQHQLRCSRGTVATCLECDEVFSRDEIIHHLAQIHGVSVTSNGLFGKRKISVKEPKSKNSGHLCGHCDRTFKTKREFLG